MSLFCTKIDIKNATFVIGVATILVDQDCDNCGCSYDNCGGVAAIVVDCDNCGWCCDNCEHCDNCDHPKNPKDGGDDGGKRTAF